MMMVYKENNISETKKVERKLPEDFQFPVILRLVSLSLLMQSGHMCENLLFLTNFSKTGRNYGDSVSTNEKREALLRFFRAFVLASCLIRNRK